MVRHAFRSRCAAECRSRSPGALGVRDSLRRPGPACELRQRDADRRGAHRLLVAEPGRNQGAEGRSGALLVRAPARHLLGPASAVRRTARLRGDPVRPDRGRACPAGIRFVGDEVRRLLRRPRRRHEHLRRGRREPERARDRDRKSPVVCRDRDVVRRCPRAAARDGGGPERRAAQLSPAGRRAHMRHAERRDVSERRRNSALGADARSGARRLLRPLRRLDGHTGLALARPARPPGAARPDDRGPGEGGRRHPGARLLPELLDHVEQRHAAGAHSGTEPRRQARSLERCVRRKVAVRSHGRSGLRGERALRPGDLSAERARLRAGSRPQREQRDRLPGPVHVGRRVAHGVPADRDAREGLETQDVDRGLPRKRARLHAPDDREHEHARRFRPPSELRLLLHRRRGGIR